MPILAGDGSENRPHGLSACDSVYEVRGDGGLITSPTIDAKIRELFEMRGVVAYARASLNEESVCLWWQRTEEIQRRIYALDQYYEAHARIGDEREHALWNYLLRASAFLGTKEREALESAVEDLRQYGRDEGRIHTGCLFERDEWLGIARRKSADVNLARELVYSLMSKRAPRRPVRSFLRLFDQVMEIAEDISDVREDCHDWNMNFWLTPIRQGRCVSETIETVGYTLQELCCRSQDAWDSFSWSEQLEHRRWWLCLNRTAKWLLQNETRSAAVLINAVWTPYSSMPLVGGEAAAPQAHREPKVPEWCREASSTRGDFGNAASKTREPPCQPALVLSSC